MGNAAFHSGRLYPSLEGSLGPLKAALEDEDEKTRANAAGAIGNLLKNDGILAPAIARLGLPECLIKMAVIDTDPAAQVSLLSHGSSYLIASKRNAVFSLGNMALYDICR